MRKSFITLLVTSAALVACQKASEVNPISFGETVTITLKASQEEATKTVLNGTAAKWAEGDKVTVMYIKDGESTWSIAESSAASTSDAYATATFEATLATPDAGKMAYAIYPATALAQNETGKAKITIEATQHPTGTCFDGKSDIMISKPFTPSTSPIETQFARANAVLKIKINNATLASEKLVSLSVTGANALVGDVLVGLADHDVQGIENGNNTVTAEYALDKQFELGADGKFVYLIVKPQTLASGSHLIISGTTENYSFFKDITLVENIYVNAGHIIPLNIDISSDVTLKEKVFFEERWSNTSGTGGNDLKWSNNIAISDVNSDESSWTYAYAGGGLSCIKLGKSSSGKGLATTRSLEIPAPYVPAGLKLSFRSAGWSGDAETLNISATNATLSSSSVTLKNGVDDSDNWDEHIIDITITESPISITFEGNAEKKARFFLDDVCIYYGTKPVEKLSPGLAFSSSTASAYLGETASFTEPSLTNTHGLLITYTSDDEAVATVAADGQVTLIGAGTANISATFAGDATYKAQTVSYELTVSTPTITIAPAGDITMGGTASDKKTITITATHAWTATLNAAATSARGTSFKILDGSDALISGTVSGTAGITTIKFEALGDGDADEITSFGTITFTDNLYASANTGAINIKQSNKGASIYALYSGAITEGDYVIYYNGKAMKNTVTSNRLDYLEVTPSEDIITNPDASIVWHIAANGDYWTIYNTTVSKYAGGTGSNNQGALLGSVTNYAKWTITGNATYEFENYGRADKTNKYLRNNGTYGFACYSTSTGGKLSLYKLQ